MCTLTYIPTGDGFVLTHNRDEDRRREPAAKPLKHTYRNIELTFPKDGKAGGTWMAHDSNRVVCLLNGAFVKHNHLPPYRKSRGLVLLDIFTFPHLLAFKEAYDLTDIEPFTVIEIQDFKSFELRWDGINCFISPLGNEPKIWSSATLYSPEIQEKRVALFHDFLKRHPFPSSSEIFLFHLTGKMGDPDSELVMKKPNGVQTLCVSQIQRKASNIQFLYLDLMHHELQLL